MEDKPARTITQLLMTHTDSYSPPETILTCNAGLNFMALDQSNFEALNCVEMEDIAGIVTLGNYCEREQEKKSSLLYLKAIKCFHSHTDWDEIHWTVTRYREGRGLGVQIH